MSRQSYCSSVLLYEQFLLETYINCVMGVKCVLLVELKIRHQRYSTVCMCAVLVQCKCYTGTTIPLE